MRRVPPHALAAAALLALALAALPLRLDAAAVRLWALGASLCG